MTIDKTTTREVPEDQSRKQILVYEVVRDYIRQRSRANSNTYSQQLDTWLPGEDEEVYFEREEQEIKNIKATPSIHGRVLGMTGDRVKPGEVVALYALLAAVENGDLEVAAEMAEHVPELLWDIFELVDDDA